MPIRALDPMTGLTPFPEDLALRPWAEVAGKDAGGGSWWWERFRLAASSLPSKAMDRLYVPICALSEAPIPPTD